MRCFAAAVLLLLAACTPAASFMMPVSRRAAGQLVKAAVAFRPFGSQVSRAEEGVGWVGGGVAGGTGEVFEPHLHAS